MGSDTEIATLFEEDAKGRGVEDAQAGSSKPAPAPKEEVPSILAPCQEVMHQANAEHINQFIPDRAEDGSPLMDCDGNLLDSFELRFPTGMRT